MSPEKDEINGGEGHVRVKNNRKWEGEAEKRAVVALTVDEVVSVPTSKPTVSLFSPLRSSSP